MTKALHTTNVLNTFIRVAEDCPARTGEEPPPRGDKPTVAGLQFQIIARAPYKYTSDDVVFATSAAGRQLDAKATKKARSLGAANFSPGGRPACGHPASASVLAGASMPTPRAALRSMPSTASAIKRLQVTRSWRRRAPCGRSGGKHQAQRSTGCRANSTLHGVVFVILIVVMPGLVPGIHVLGQARKSWMAGP